MSSRRRPKEPIEFSFITINTGTNLIPHTDSTCAFYAAVHPLLSQTQYMQMSSSQK